MIDIPPPAAMLFVMVVGPVPEKAMPLPAVKVVDGTDAPGTRLPPASNTAPRLARPARGGRVAMVSPGGTRTVRPATSLVRSQVSRFCATMSVSA